VHLEPILHQKTCSRIWFKSDI